MSRSTKSLFMLVSLVLLSLIIVACAQPAQAPQVVKETVIVEKEVVKEVEVPAEGELVTLVARCRAKPPTEDWRCNNLLNAVAEVNADLEAAGDTRRVVVETIQDNTDWGDIMQEFALSYEDGKAPDILTTGHEFIGTEATAGRIIALDDMLGDYPEFDNVIGALWDSVMFQGKRWGVPQDTESRPVYWDKTLLVQVPGWDEARIAGLTDEIKAGNFTLDDLLDTAEAAVAAGVVEPGMGF